MFGKLSLRVKLVGAFFVTATLIGLVSFFGLNASTGIHRALKDIVDNDLPRISSLQELQISSLKLSQYVHEYKESSDKSVAKAQVLSVVDKLNKDEKTYRQFEAEGAEKEVLETITAEVSASKDSTTSLALVVVELSESKAIESKTKEFDEAAQKLEAALVNAINQEIASTNAESVYANSQITQSYSTTMAITALAAAFALLIGLLISLGIGRNLKKLQEGSKHLASGDFSKEIIVKSQDELGQLARSFNDMSTSLRGSYRRLALEKQRDETLLESMSEGMVAIDDQGKISLINNVALRLFELPESDTVGANFDQLITLFDENQKPLDPAQTITNLTLKMGESVNAVYSRLNKERAKALVNVAASPIKLEGRIAGAILVLRDVTKEKEVDRMKTEFISLASHQLRTPLSAIKWFSEMLLEGDAGELKPEQADFAKNISDSTDRMVDLVNSLLNISRIESGRIIVDPKPTDLNELIGGIVNDLKAKTEERQQSLVISVHPGIPKINLDPRLIGQVYLNLLTNAIKYTPKKGEIAVFVSRKGEDIVSQVTDNGYGIPQAQQGRIFQKFFRADNVSKVETDGTGLGLYLIKAIVESSGGKIWFESKEGKGTTFWFTLPMSGMKAKAGEVTLDA